MMRSAKKQNAKRHKTKIQTDDNKRKQQQEQ